MDFSSEHYFFAEDIVYCIVFHYWKDAGWITPCPKSNKRYTHITPYLEKLIVKSLFLYRKKINSQFTKHLQDLPWRLPVFSIYVDKETSIFMNFVNQLAKDVPSPDQKRNLLTKAFVNHCLRIAGIAENFQRRRSALQSYNIATWRIYATTKSLTEGGHLCLEELTSWGPEFEEENPEYLLGLEPTPPYMNTTAYFRITDKTTPVQHSMTSDTNSALLATYHSYFDFTTTEHSSTKTMESLNNSQPLQNFTHSVTMEGSHLKSLSPTIKNFENLTLSNSQFMLPTNDCCLNLPDTRYKNPDISGVVEDEHQIKFLDAHNNAIPINSAESGSMNTNSSHAVRMNSNISNSLFCERTNLSNLTACTFHSEEMNKKLPDSHHLTTLNTGDLEELGIYIP